VKQQLLLQLQQQEQRELEQQRQKQADEDAALALKAQQKADARAQRLLQMRQRKAEAHARELESRRIQAEATRSARRELRLLNQRASSGVKGARPDRDFFKSLDSTLKKNTAFVRKVRLIAPDNAEATLLEASKLNLSRFLQELTPAVVEARLKRADVLPTVQLCSLLHQRHAEFMTELMPMIFAAFASVKGERAEQFVRQRAYLMLLSECYVAHCVPDSESAGTVGALYGRPLVKLIDELIASDEQTVVDRADSIVVDAPQPFVLGLVVTFAQRGDEAFLGVMKRVDRALPSLDDAADDNNDADADVETSTAESAGGDAPDTNDAAESGEYAPADAADIVFGEAARAALRTRLLTYFERVSKHTAAMFTRASKQAFLDEQALNLKGELSDERKSSSAMLRTYVDRLVADATALAAVLGVSMPELVAYKEEIVVAPQFEIDDLVRGDSYDVLWGDVDTRRFYESLPPLREMLPTALVGEGSGFIGNTDDNCRWRRSRHCRSSVCRQQWR
jgi:regulator of nonsense transcripts 2